MLGVGRTASADEIKKAYRALAQKYHPDRNADDAEAEEQFKAVSAANAVLSDPDRRAAYDEFGDIALDANFDAEKARQAQQTFGGGFGGAGFQGGGFGDQAGGFGSIFEDLFGGAQGHGHPRRPARGRDLEADLELEFRDAALGTERRISISRPLANGGVGSESLTVSVPPGVDDGQRIRLAGKGGEAPGGHGPAGDLLCRIRVRPHPYFKRDDRNLTLDLPVSMRETTLGAEVDVPTLENSVQLRVPPGADGGAKLRLRGKGIPAAGGKPAGDLIVTLRIKTPKQLDDEAREALERLLPDDGDELRKKRFG